MKPISPTEPVTDLRRIKIIENGEPLVNFLEIYPSLMLDRPRFDYERETFLRKSVAEKLFAANESLLSKGMHLRIIEGWRPPFIQRRMYEWSWARFTALHPEWSETRLRRTTNRFTAPMTEKVPPPHTTGGAMDLALYKGDTALQMVDPYEQRDHKGFVANAPLLGDEAKRHREIMAEALLPTGITNYPSEYWHWSYGDQGWAYRGGHDHAIYAAITPPNWQPHESHTRKEPLNYVFE
ncbi:M15 family metallopeptidase [soil metagenome]